MSDPEWTCQIAIGILALNNGLDTEGLCDGVPIGANSAFLHRRIDVLGAEGAP